MDLLVIIDSKRLEIRNKCSACVRMFVMCELEFRVAFVAVEVNSVWPTEPSVTHCRRKHHDMKFCLYGKHFIHFHNNLILMCDSTEQICPVGIDSVKWDLNKPFLEE